jgi:hypothetical protein
MRVPRFSFRLQGRSWGDGLGESRGGRSAAGAGADLAQSGGCAAGGGRMDLRK